ncbi:MAG: hypothetical protein ABJB09_04165, partial [Verrucomicrobiota bacterium]
QSDRDSKKSKTFLRAIIPGTHRHCSDSLVCRRKERVMLNKHRNGTKTITARLSFDAPKLLQ